MDDQEVSSSEHQKLVLAYHGLPVVTAFILVGVFLTGLFLTGSYLVSSVAAGISSALLMWRWIRVGKQIDRGCPKCSGPFPKKMGWSYPPRVCPLCGEKLR
jgi:hypothetical protein